MEPVKVEYIEPFIEAARSVLEDALGEKVTTGAISLSGTVFKSASVNLATRVDGTLNGEAVFSMSSQTAQRLSGLMTGTEARSFGKLMGNGLSELGRKLARTSADLLQSRGHNCQVSSPIVFQGLNVEFTAAEPALSIPIETEAGLVEVSVAVANG